MNHNNQPPNKLISEVYLTLREHMPKWHRLCKSINDRDGDDLLNEAICRICEQPHIPNTFEKLYSMTESYIWTVRKEWLSEKYRHAILSQDYARTQDTSTENNFELSIDMVVPTNTNLLGDALNKAIVKKLSQGQKKKHIASDLHVDRSTVHRRINKLKPLIKR